VKGKIIIELTLDHTPDSGSGLPDMGHTAYWIKKELAKLEYKNANGKLNKLIDDYPVTKVTVEAG
jgi:hypothetical protein